MPSGDVWTGGKTVQTAIGQLYNDFTPIQMAKYTAMLANGGKNIELTIVKSINNPDGTQVSRNEIESYVNEALGVSGNSGSDLSLSSDTIAAIRQGMKGVTSDDGGTAYSYFKDFNIEVGGKTGSASNDNSGNASICKKWTTWWLHSTNSKRNICTVFRNECITNNRRHNRYK